MHAYNKHVMARFIFCRAFQWVLWSYKFCTLRNGKGQSCFPPQTCSCFMCTCQPSLTMFYWWWLRPLVYLLARMLYLLHFFRIKAGILKAENIFSFHLNAFSTSFCPSCSSSCPCPILSSFQKPRRKCSALVLINLHCLLIESSSQRIITQTAVWVGSGSPVLRVNTPYVGRGRDLDDKKTCRTAVLAPLSCDWWCWCSKLASDTPSTRIIIAGF